MKGVMKKSFKNLEKGDKVYRVVPKTESIGDEVSGEVCVVDLYVEEFTIEGFCITDMFGTTMFKLSEGNGVRKHMSVYAKQLHENTTLSDGYYWFTDREGADNKRYEMFQNLLNDTEREYERVLKKFNTMIRNFYKL